MARSVSTPSGAAFVIHTHFEPEDEFDAQFEFDMMVEDLQREIQTTFPSFRESDRFIGREDRVILENDHAAVTISEYMGLIAIAVVPEDDNDHPGLSSAWVDQIESKFKALMHSMYAVLVPKGTFSNGEQVFAPASRPEGVYTSKEGMLW